MNHELQVAKEAAVEAGKIILGYYKSDYEIKDKGYHNPVTTADKASDKKIKDILTTTFPEYGWLSEETVDSKERLKKKKSLGCGSIGWHKRVYRRYSTLCCKHWPC